MCGKRKRIDHLHPQPFLQLYFHAPPLPPHQLVTVLGNVCRPQVNAPLKCIGQVEEYGVAKQFYNGLFGRVPCNANLAEVMSALNEMKKDNDTPSRKDIIRWLSPAKYEPTYYRDRKNTLLDSKCDGTCQWLAQEDRVLAWIFPQSPESVLWLHGNPGTGKSVLTASLVHEILETSDPRQTTVSLFLYRCKKQ